MVSENPREVVVKQYVLELRKDSADEVVVWITQPPKESLVEICLREPNQPSNVTIRAHGEFNGNWIQRGWWSAEANLDLKNLPPGHSLRPQGDGSFRHRHLRGDCHVHIQPHDRSWRIHIKCRVGGRGSIRPVLAMASMIVGRKLRNALEKSAAGLTKAVQRVQEELNDLERKSLDETGHPLRPNEMVAQGLREYLQNLPEHVESTGRGRGEVPENGERDRATDPQWRSR